MHHHPQNHDNQAIDLYTNFNPVPTSGRSHLQTAVFGEVDLHEDPDGEGQGSQEREDESVGEMIVHRQLHVILPQPQSSAYFHQ